MVSTSTALVPEVPQKKEEKVVQSSSLDKDVIVDEYGITSASKSGGDLYSLQELEQLEDECMALIVKRFGNYKFRRNPNIKSNYNKLQRGGSSSPISTRGGYKNGTVDGSKICFFNCNDMEHFATECKKPRQIKNASYDVN